MKHIRLIGLILISMTMILSACSPAAPTSPPVVELTPTTAPTVAETPSAAVVVQDAEGKEFRLEAPAQRVISLAPSNTEILFAIGAGKQVIAREDFSNFPEEAAKLPSIGGNMGVYNLEEVARLEPDLILASPLTSAEALKSLQGITPHVLTLPNPKDLDGLYANLVTVGILTGHKTEAETLAADLKSRAQAVLEKVKNVSEKPKVYYELDATDPAKPWTAGPGSFVDLLIRLAGGENVGASLNGEWAQISQEALIVENPNVILLGDSTYGGITPEQVTARPGWSGIAAVANQKVLPFNDDLVSRPGPRLIDGLEAIAKAIHPELFE